jgi:tripartite-type tricarboxylate transporter receptor subunit TctC
MSRKSGHRFSDKDMRKRKNLRHLLQRPPELLIGRRVCFQLARVAIGRGDPMKRRDLLKAGMAALAVPALPRQGFAEAAYPDRPVRLIVPFPPGGAFDTVARPWADRIKPYLGTVIIENIGGAGGGVGAAQAARSRRDGYTLLLGGATTHITEALLKTKPTFDPLKDLEPISPIAVTAFAIAVHPSVPANNLKELVAYVKANPNKMSYGSAGHGSLNHLTGELFKLRAGLTDFPHVPYRGAGPGLTDLLAGQIPALVPAMTNIVAEHHRAGKLKVLAVTHGKRLAAAPELPTAVEQGYPDLVAPNFIGVFAPAGVPKEVVAAVSAANLKLCAEKSYQELLISGTFELEPLSSPAQYTRYVESELTRWKPIVTALNIKID